MPLSICTSYASWTKVVILIMDLKNISLWNTSTRCRQRSRYRAGTESISPKIMTKSLSGANSRLGLVTTKIIFEKRTRRILQRQNVWLIHILLEYGHLTPLEMLALFSLTLYRSIHWHRSSLIERPTNSCVCPKPKGLSSCSSGCIA